MGGEDQQHGIPRKSLDQIRITVLAVWYAYGLTRYLASVSDTRVYARHAKTCHCFNIATGGSSQKRQGNSPSTASHLSPSSSLPQTQVALTSSTSPPGAARTTEQSPHQHLPQGPGIAGGETFRCLGRRLEKESQDAQHARKLRPQHRGEELAWFEGENQRAHAQPRGRCSRSRGPQNVAPFVAQSTGGLLGDAQVKALLKA